MISEKPFIELCILIDGEKREYFISGHNGHFNWGLLQKYEEDLSDEPQTEILDVIKKNSEVDYGTITLLIQLTEVETEVQYGTGYGDLLTFEGYYDTKVIEVTNIEIADRPPDLSFEYNMDF